MTGRPRRLRRLPPETRKAAQRDRFSYDAERKAVLAALRAEAASERVSAFALLSADFTRKLAGARARYRGHELAAALDAIHADHLAAERALSLKLMQGARARRRVVLGGLRERRKGHRREFRTAAHTLAHRVQPAARSQTKQRAALHIPRVHTRKPRH